MRCLVTGARGFIGTHLVRSLLDSGHEVHLTDDGSNSVEPLPPRLRENIVDSYWLIDGPFDCIFHLAAVSRTMRAVGDSLRCNAINVTGSLNVMELVRRCKARLVLASSNIVYGSANPYKASKLAMEAYAEAYRECYGLNVVVLRYSNVYGPGMRWDDSLCLAAMRRSAVEKGYIELTGDGTQRRHFTHVSDIVKGTIAACESNYQGDPVDLCYPEEVSLNEAAACFGVPIQYIPERVGDSFRLPQNPAAAEIFFDWQARIPFYEGIRDVIAESKHTEVAA